MTAPTPLRYFTVSEVGLLEDDVALMLDQTRALAGVPIYITSGMRPGDDGAHGEGRAVDISDNTNGEPLESYWRYRVVMAAIYIGFTRIGIYDRHIHLDTSTTRPQQVMWWGTSD